MPEKAISLETALSKCLPYSIPGDREFIPIEHALRRVAAEDIYTPVDLPLFTHSKVDGFAVHASDLNKLLLGKETRLAIADTAAAGDLSPLTLKPGQTIRIMTGAMIPDKTAAVIKKENVRIVNDEVCINQEVKPGINIQNRGDFLKMGERIVAAGEVLGINHTEIIASAGLSQVSVFTIPPVYVINTGSELVLPGENRLDGQVFASNKTLFYSLLKAAGCHPLGAGRPVKDKIDAIIQELYEGIKKSRVIIISGGTAEGQYDLVQSAFQQIGASIIFEGLDLKPGRHTSAAEKDGILLFNLPGSPGAGYIIFEILVKPWLRKLKGISAYQNKWIELPIEQHDRFVTDQRMMVKGGAEIKNGQLTARVMNKGQNSDSFLKLIIDLDPASSTIKALIAD